MPIYAYVCQERVLPEPAPATLEGAIEALKPCGHEYEVFYLSISRAEVEEPDEACPRCGGKAKKRLISQGTSHILKGTGWAKDNYS